MKEVICICFLYAKIQSMTCSAIENALRFNLKLPWGCLEQISLFVMNSLWAVDLMMMIQGSELQVYWERKVTKWSVEAERWANLDWIQQNAFRPGQVDCEV